MSVSLLIPPAPTAQLAMVLRATGGMVKLLALSSCAPSKPRLQNCQLRAHDVEVLIAQLRNGPYLEDVE